MTIYNKYFDKKYTWLIRHIKISVWKSWNQVIDKSITRIPAVFKKYCKNVTFLTFSYLCFISSYSSVLQYDKLST